MQDRESLCGNDADAGPWKLMWHDGDIDSVHVVKIVSSGDQLLKNVGWWNRESTCALNEVLIIFS